MTRKVTDEDLLQRMSRVEFPDRDYRTEQETRDLRSMWVESQLYPAHDPEFTYAGVRREYNEWHEKYRGRPDASLGVIYGDGSLNRWFVTMGGDVYFSRCHARSGSVELAEREGFEVQ